MLVFVTGASGFIGQATVQELLSHGHSVLGLARSDASAETLTKLGAQVLRGDLEDVTILTKGAQQADGVAHLGFVNDFANFARSANIDATAVETMGNAIAGTAKPIVIVSGTLALQQTGQLGYEDSPVDRVSPLSVRNKASDIVYALAKEKGVRGSVVRFAPTVHAVEDTHGFVPSLAGAAKKNGFVAYVGEGAARWPAVHRLDAAVVMRLALEKGTPGATYHAVAEQGVAVKDVMEAIAKRLGVPAVSKTPEEAMELLGFFGGLLSADNPTSSEKTQKELGWTPTHAGILEDIEKNYKF